MLPNVFIECVGDKLNTPHCVVHFIKCNVIYLYKQCFWLIWFINQRALYNHALSIIVIGVILHQHWCWHHCLYTPPPGTWLDIETSYLVHMSPIYAHQIFNDSDL